jgi:hypothetical protein
MKYIYFMILYLRVRPKISTVARPVRRESIAGSSRC